MSRFHDEFFRQGSPAHDALMIKCTSTKGIQKITEEIGLAASMHTFAESIAKGGVDKTVTICHFEVGRVAWKGINSGDSWSTTNKNAPRIYRNYAGVFECELKNDKKCEYVEKCLLGAEDTTEKRDATLAVHLNADKTVHTYETEVIVKNGAFIIGYADAVIKSSAPCAVDAVINDEWTWKEYGKLEPQIDILIEAKPKLTSIGEVIRQLKTYRERLQRDIEIRWYAPGHYTRKVMIPMRAVIVTYTKLDSDALQYLKNEGIDVVVFEEGGA